MNIIFTILFSILLQQLQQQEYYLTSAISTPQFPSQYIIKYHGYWSRAVRIEFLSQQLLFYLPYSWKIIPRHFDDLDNFFSDFDVIEIPQVKHVMSITHLLLNHSTVSSIYKDAIIPRKPLFEDEGDVKSFRKPLSIKTDVTALLRAEVLHNLGFWGQGVRVGVFDTGLNADHPHFHQENIRERINWTNEPTVQDGMGHGTFVAGTIAAKITAPCPGFAPQADLFIFRVFTNAQISYTSWFLDAFNYAMARKIHVINLSIGGPDFMDRPFVDKVLELSANGIVLISAIGNDGPLYGTLNNPADHPEVIGVGGIDYEDHIARFSSRGMTTWELPSGYGRVKPDLVTYASAVWGSAIRGDCKTLSGTTVASAVAAGAVTLLYSSVLYRGDVINPGSMKQALVASARRLEFTPANIYEQGFGKLDLLAAYQILKSYRPQASLSPSYLDFTQCPYFWPFCVQPLYYSSRTVVFNVTILNGMSVVGHILQPPQWHVYANATTLHNHPHKHYEANDLLAVDFTYSQVIWPWSGHLALHFTVTEAAKYYSGILEGFVSLTVTSPIVGQVDSPLVTHLKLPVRVRIEPTPVRSKRLLWDMYHNLRYPPGYFPRDDLRAVNAPLDWNGDHPHTNFKGLFDHLRRRGFFVEILGEPFTCFNASLYGALLLVDLEDEFHIEERDKLYKDVTENGLNILLFVDWYNTSVMQKLRFFDENTRQWWLPQTGGANLPAINTLMEPFNISFGQGVYEGKFTIGNLPMNYQSGTHIINFPQNESSFVMYRDLTDIADWVLMTPQGKNVPSSPSGNTKEALGIPIMGVSTFGPAHGHVAVYGDSNCLDTAFLNTDCYWLVEAMLAYTRRHTLPHPLLDSMKPWKQPSSPSPSGFTPERNYTHFHLYSRTVDSVADVKQPHFRPLATCGRVNIHLGVLDKNKPPSDAYFPKNLERISPEEMESEQKMYRDLQTSSLNRLRVHQVHQFIMNGGGGSETKHLYLFVGLIFIIALVLLYWVLMRLIRSARITPTHKGSYQSRNSFRFKRVTYERLRA